jgi:RimJ/RimL family protein N-acetyltransferase
MGSMSSASPTLDSSGGFRTARLCAERLCADHLADLVRMHSDPLHMATLGGVRDDTWTRAYLNRNLAHWEAHGFGLWMLRPDPHGPIIGRSLLRHLEVDGVDEVEVGYSFVPDHWGRGLATEVATACLTIGRSNWGFTSMVAVTLPTNLASRHVLEKAGLHFERDIIHAGQPHVLYRSGCRVRP